MEYNKILYSQKGGVATIIMNDPDRLNPLTVDLLSEVQDALKRIEEDEGVRVAVITGAGRAFSAGGDIANMAKWGEANPWELQETLHKVHHSVVLMRKLEKPIIAHINGHAFGAGLDFIMACDIRIASSEAKFCEAYLRLALSPGMGALYMLPRFVGLGRALNMILTSKEIDAQEAERIGLVDVVVPPDKLAETVGVYAERFANGPTKAIGVAKRALLRGLSSDLETEQNWTAYEQAVQFLSRDTREGMTAFLEKRKPRYTGQH